MTKVDRIIQEWTPSAQKMLESDAMTAIWRQTIGIPHYMSYLRETYHHAGHNPQIQAIAATRLPKEQRAVIGRFLAHAKSEIGHDLLALNDYTFLGGNPDDLLKGRPLPITAALNGYIVFRILNDDPVTYLGYLFHLEFMPTIWGAKILDGLTKANIPKQAMSFLVEHNEIDAAHNEMFKTYTNDLIQTEAQLEKVILTAKDTCYLHSLMVSEAFNNPTKSS
jgi:pyrroloquinoline quinone (PQQ) biosynthesis protein C